MFEAEPQELKEKDIILSEDQEMALTKSLEWFKKSRNKPSLLKIGGLAGTGKTTILDFFEKETQSQNINISFIAFMGIATVNMKKRATHHHPISTAHSFMYKAIVNEFNEITGWELKRMAKDLQEYYEDRANYLAYPSDLIVIDEASTIPEEMLNDLLSYNVPILAVGDHGQLPPPRGMFNLMENPDIQLEKIHRYAGDLAHLALDIRNGKYLPHGRISDQIEILPNSQNHERLEYLYTHPSKDILIITGTNKDRTFLNKRILEFLDPKNLREDIKTPNVGDRVICLKNNKRLGMYNGMRGTVQSTHSAELSPIKNIKLEVEFDDSHTVITDVARYPFLDPKPMVPERDKWGDYGDLFDYSYALTGHKVQGMQAKSVIVSGTGFGNSALRRRWCYTAVTRSEGELYWIKK